MSKIKHRLFTIDLGKIGAIFNKEIVRFSMGSDTCNVFEAKTISNTPLA